MPRASGWFDLKSQHLAQQSLDARNLCSGGLGEVRLARPMTEVAEDIQVALED